MADVQLEKGYLRIANELFEQFYIRDFRLIQLKILLFILRFSYGCNKKSAVITPQNSFCLLHIYESDIKKELKNLELNKVISCDYKNGIFTINKNYDEWKYPIHTLFSEEKNKKLINQNLSNSLSNTLVNNEDLDKNLQQAETENLSNLLTTKEITKPDLSNSLSNTLVNNEDLQPENTGSTEVSTLSKDILNTSKDILNTSFIKEEEISKKINHQNDDFFEEPKISETSSEKIKNVSLMDPYFNPIRTAFEKEYKKIYKTSCYLNNFQLPKLLEIASVVPTFIEIMPEMLTKLSKIRFDIKGKKEKQTVGLRWLLDDGNWAGVLRGEFDQYMEADEGSENKENMSFFEKSALEFQKLMNEGDCENE